MPSAPIEQSSEWWELASHQAQIADVPLRQLFADDPARGERFALIADGMYLDYSKQRVTAETLNKLFALARRADLESAIDELFAGKNVNVTENRPALHMALRAVASDAFPAVGENVVPAVLDVIAQMTAFANDIRNGERVGATGQKFSTIVNIGIGGSDLGPKLVIEALDPITSEDIEFRFLSSVDSDQFAAVTKGLNPATTLFIISSKSFTTAETMRNARTARNWISAQLGDRAVGDHFVAVSASAAAVEEFGIKEDLYFPFWDWVGGRFSVASAIGLSVMIAIGPERFGDFLAGMRAMDSHFHSAPLEKNAPVLLALLGIWNSNFMGATSFAMLPYSYRLRSFPAYLQQLSMESLGKSTSLEGQVVGMQTGDIVWGAVGTDAQHSFFQLLHQGTRFIPCDFIGLLEPATRIGEHHDELIANLFAQSEALAFGRDVDSDAETNGRQIVGNKPSTTILLPELSPFTLGQLIALYEHKTYVQSVIWGVNAFDQFGVELGKKLAAQILQELTDPDVIRPHDSSTSLLIAHYKNR
ncbi:MAG: glucosephosphate isomerase [Actinomycetota bacterium]